MITIDLARSRAALALLGCVPETDEETIAAFASAAWSCLIEPGDAVAGRMISVFGAVDALRLAQRRDVSDLAREMEVENDDIARARSRWAPRFHDVAVDDAFARAARANVRLITPRHRSWPRSLNDLGDHAPLCLWFRGNAAVFSRYSAHVAIVGARAATGYGEHVASEFAAELAARGVVVVSGAAYGIDGFAHRATLAAGGTSIAVLAGGADRPYPSGHARLIDSIATKGLVCSEVPCGSAPTKWRFLQRNRVIAALADATVVVEAGWRSGSLNTAGHAAALSRPLGAVPGPVTSAASAGCHRLLREFDARCVTGVDDVIELLGLDSGEALFDSESTDTAPRTNELTRVTDALSTRSPRNVDDIARRSGMSNPDVQQALGMLQLEQKVRRVESGWVATGS